MTNWVLMTRDDEQKLVHPGNVKNHINAGWRLPDDPAKAETEVAVAVETAPAEESVDDSVEATVAEESFEAETPAEADDDPS